MQSAIQRQPRDPSLTTCPLSVVGHANPQVAACGLRTADNSRVSLHSQPRLRNRIANTMPTIAIAARTAG